MGSLKDVKKLSKWAKLGTLSLVSKFPTKHWYFQFWFQRQELLYDIAIKEDFMEKYYKVA